MRYYDLYVRNTMTNIMEKQFYRQRKDFDLSCIERDKKFTMPEGVSGDILQ